MDSLRLTLNSAPTGGFGTKELSDAEHESTDSDSSDSHDQYTESHHPTSDSPSSFAEITTSALNSNAGHSAVDNAPEFIEIPSGETPTTAGTDSTAVDNEQDPNSSVNLIHLGSLTGRQFATPLKLLPPLKDIEHIVTPKSFGVAKDDKDTVVSSPVSQAAAQILPEIGEDPEDAFDATANDTFAKLSTQVSGTQPRLTGTTNFGSAAIFLGLEPAEVAQLREGIVSRIAQRALEYHGIQSELSFYTLNQAHANQVHASKCDAFQKQISRLLLRNDALAAENEALNETVQRNETAISSLKNRTRELTDKLDALESSIKRTASAQTLAVSSRDLEISRLNESVNKLVEQNMKQSQLLNMLTNELNDETNQKFQLKLELTKATNELTYSQKQKEWYSDQLKKVQENYTDTIKNRETEYLKLTNEVSALASQNDSFSATKAELEVQVKDLEEKLEKAVTKVSVLESKAEVLRINYLKETAANEEMMELIKVQLQERETRISQLESYAEDLKESASTSVGELQEALSEKDDKLVLLEVKLKRTEAAFGAELQRESDLPRISTSDKKILSDGNLNISLLSLYAEFILVKKELILEKSQKEKLATQLKHFVAELESKKPAIANYRNQVHFYEQSMRELLEKLEALRADKTESDKECARLRARLSNSDTERTTMKQLVKDLGRQLCYYLIHSNIREGKDDPLSSSERKAIDTILAKSGVGDGTPPSDTDLLITERLVVFSSVVELQRKNEELLVAVRKLGSELEDQDLQKNGFEVAAVEEAKDAILTLQSELDCANLRLDAVSKERDNLKSFAPGSAFNRSVDNGRDYQAVVESHRELKSRAKELEESLCNLQRESSEKLRVLTEKALNAASANDELKLQLSAAHHSINLLESRLANAKKFLDNLQKMVDHTRAEVEFWKHQAAKQEDLLVKRSNELRDEEKKVLEYQAKVHSLKVDRELLMAAQEALQTDLRQLRDDKKNLSSFVTSLQELLSERESSSAELSSKLSQSVVNYQQLQDRINEKEERIQLLTSQSELSLKAQNSKLEQVNELSLKLLEARTKLAEQQMVLERLRVDLARKPAPARAPEESTFGTETSVLRSQSVDIEDLRLRLKDAESQVSKFTSIARASEQALESANNSYEEYRVTNAETIGLLEKDKEKLAQSLSESEELSHTLEGQLHESEVRFRAEVEALQTKILESLYKVMSFDQMKQDLEQKINIINSELQSQMSLHNDLVRHHESKLSENELLNLQVAKQKEDIETLTQESAAALAELQTVCNKISSSEASLRENYASQEEKLLAAQSKIVELEYQYNLALNQIELKLSVGEFDENNPTEDLRQVVRFLRHEKEVIETKNIQLVNDLLQMKADVDSLTLELSATKAQISRLQTNKVKVDESVQEHARLMEQLEQLNILRESNVTLRNEIKDNEARLAQSEATILELQNKFNSQSVDSMVAAISLQELQLLKEENARLKSQLENNEDYKTLMQRFENLKAEFKAKLLGHRNKNKELEKLLGEIKASYETVQKELADIKSNSRLGSENAETLQNLQKQLSDLQAEKDQIIKNLEDEKKTVLCKFAADKDSALAKLKAEKDVLIKKLQGDLEKAKQEYAKRAEVPQLSKPDAEKKTREEYEQKIAALNEDFESRLTKEIESAKESVEKKYEFKLKVLNRKVEQLEKERTKGSQLDASRGGERGKRPLPQEENATKKVKKKL